MRSKTIIFFILSVFCLLSVSRSFLLFNTLRNILSPQPAKVTQPQPQSQPKPQPQQPQQQSQSKPQPQPQIQSQPQPKPESQPNLQP